MSPYLPQRGRERDTGSGHDLWLQHPGNGWYDAVGNLLSYSDCQSNGCVTGAWNMSYDQLNRLTGASSSSGPWNTLSLGWVYDPFGDRTSQSISDVQGQYRWGCHRRSRC